MNPSNATSDSRPYLTPEQVTCRILDICIAHLLSLIENRVDPESTVADGEQMRFVTPNGRGYINFYPGSIEIRGVLASKANLKYDLKWGDYECPGSVQVKIKGVRQLLRDWIHVRAAVEFSKIF